jgi:hypothetical protein
MHRQVAALLAAGGSPGKLAQLGRALGASKIDIATTGGAEWMHTGPVTLMIKEDWGKSDEDQIGTLADVMAAEKFPWLVFRTVEVELKDVPGALGEAAAVLGNADINIYTVTVLRSTGGKASVGLGVRPREVKEAIRLLKQAHYKVGPRRHPKDTGDDPDSWLDGWDTRTDELLDWFEANPGTSPSDPKFYERGQTAD